MEYPDAFCEKWRIARKPHKCCECRGTIFYKERYLYTSGVWDGRGESYKTCADCSELRDTLNKNTSYDDGCCFGGLREYVMEDHFVPDIKKLVEIWDKRGVRVSPRNQGVGKKRKSYLESNPS